MCEMPVMAGRCCWATAQVVAREDSKRRRRALLHESLVILFDGPTFFRSSDSIRKLDKVWSPQIWVCGHLPGMGLCCVPCEGCMGFAACGNTVDRARMEGILSARR